MPGAGVHSDEYREVCFSNHGEECVICGDAGELVAHHVDGDRSNNSPENLRPMCRSCHRSVHNGGEGFEEWTDKLPERSVIDRSDTMKVRPREVEILRTLSEGAKSPKSIRERTGLRKGDCRTGIDRLGKFGMVVRVARGVYQITDRGVEEIDDAD